MTNAEKLSSMIADASDPANPNVEVATGKVWEYAEIGKMVMDVLAMSPVYNRPSVMCNKVMMSVLTNLSHAPQGSIPAELGPKFMNDSIAKNVQWYLDEVREQALKEVHAVVQRMRAPGTV